MALKWLTNKETAEELTENTYIVVTQNETKDGVTRNVVRRIPFNNFAAQLGADLDFDDETEMAYLVNKDGVRLGEGTTLRTGISGLQMYTEQDEDTGTQYLVLEDASGSELCRTEFNVSGGGSGTSYVCRLINGMSGTLLNFPSGQNVTLSYSYYERYGNEQTTANATEEIYYKTATTDYQLMRSRGVQQGANTADITNYLQEGTNYIKLQVTGGESGVMKTIVFTVNLVNMALTSSFDESRAYTSTISFMYRVTGRDIQKTMHFLIDEGRADEYEWTVDIGKAHNTQLTENINLAPYGHGDHTLKCWFMTDGGARSQVLNYDIMFDGGSVVPIISSTFDVTEVDYGNPIQVQYYVFTHGGDYTSEVDLDIYTVEDGQTVYYSQQALANVVKEEVQTWFINEYPSEGTIYLRISAGSAQKVFAVTVHENTGGRDLNGVTTRLIAAYSVSGRSNSDVNRATMNAVYTDIDETTTTIQGTLTGFNWRSNGWLSDNAGYPVLRISGGATARLNLPFLARAWDDAVGNEIHLSGTPTGVGRTFEIIFATSGVTDENAEIMTLWDDTARLGIKIFPSKAYLLSGSMSVETDSYGNVTNKSVIPFVNFSSATKVRLSFVIEEVGHYVERIEDPDTHAITTENKQLIKIYVNGELAKVVSYSADSFDSTGAVPILSASSCIMDVYAMRFYDTALKDDEILKNYIADLPSIAERIEIYDKNDIADDGVVSLDMARKQYPCMVLTGALSAYKGDKVKIGVLLYKPNSEVEEEYTTVWEFMETDGNGKYGNVNNVQGTSSQYYIKKNYKITFYRWDAAEGKFKKVKVIIFEDRIPVNTICIKADYMSPDGANTGNANFWEGLMPEETPAQAAQAEGDLKYQTMVKGYPILVFQRDTAGDAPSFIGRYNLNNDKGNSEAFGLENDGDEGNQTKCQKWEFKDNSLPICNFQTDKLREVARNTDGELYEVWEDALESCYPDQGDLEDEGLRPNTDHIQFLYSWLVQWANFWDASEESGTGGTYNGTTYDTEKDLKRARFIREYSRHLNLPHSAWYYIVNEVPLLVDNLAKNMFLTCYDVTVEHVIDLDRNEVDLDAIIVNGVVDISRIDWENSTFAIWYPTPYDLDSCLGADNNGRDLFPYYAETWDDFNGRQIVNGRPSRLWRMFYDAFYTDIGAMYRRFRDTDRTLSTSLYLKALIDDLTAALPVVTINADEKFKYIDAFEGGYYDASANDGEGGWVYTNNYLYLAKSTMQSYHRDFITKRMTMLDGKYLSDAYRNDNFNFRINRVGDNTQPSELTFHVSPCQAMYLYTDWGNNGTYRGGKCLEGDSIAMSPASPGNWNNIVVACFGASHVKSFGDLSPLYPDLLQNLRGCVNLTELILGSGAAGYQNAALDSLNDVGTLKMLQKLDIRNCVRLATIIDLSTCDLIEEVYAEGSAITSVALPNGGYMKKLHLPGSVTNLEILDHGGLTEFQMTSYDALTRMRVENTPNVPTAAILAARGTNLARIRLVGVQWNLTSEAALRVLASSAMAGKAIDANGNNVNDTTTYPTVTGTCTIDRIQASLYNRLRTLYPNLIITAGVKYHKVVFKNEGATHDTQEVNDGEAATMPATPTKAATVQYSYSFSGWNQSYAAVTADMTINAQYSPNTQRYPIVFWSGTPEEPGTELANLADADRVSYGANYTYPNAMPTKTGYVFCGWQDADGNAYDYITQMPDASAKIDGNGVPQTINLYPVWSAVEMAHVSKSFDALTPGELLYAAIAIQKGQTSDGVTVTYYADSDTYTLYDGTNNVSVSIRLADTRVWTLYNGETITQQVLDFNHDYSDLAETNKLGISYAFKNLLTATGNMNPSYKYAYNYRFGNEEPIVSDDEDHSSATQAVLTQTHTATADEVAAGYVDITAEGPTFLKSIKVTHADETTDTWWFDYRGFWGEADAETFTRDGSGASVTTCGWYRSDLINDPDNREYKIGKMLSSLGIDPVNVSGSVGLYGWASTNYQWAWFTNDVATLANFGGIKFDTTGNDPINTATGNPYNGNGKSRIMFCKTWEYDWNNFTEFSTGAKISVPVIAGDVVEVVCYGASRNWGGWEGTRMNRWANGAFLEQLPIGLRNTIVPACKKSSWGSRTYAIRSGLYTMWLLGQRELGFNVSAHPYMDCGTKYPIFTDNASRIKKLADGAGAAYIWWERDPYVSGSGYFMYTYSSGSYNYNYAHNAHGVCLGFSSGEAAS